MKNLLLTVMILVLGNEAFAQDVPVGPNTRKKFKIGFNLSPSIDFFQPNTQGVDLDKVRAKFGYGMMAEYAFTNNYALAFGLEHKMAGASLDFGADADARYLNQSDKIEYRLLTRVYRYDYVNIPITLKLMTNEIGYFTYFGQFGVDLSVLVSSQAKDDRQPLLAQQTDSTQAVFGSAGETDFIGRYNQSMFMNVKLRIGAGFEWNFSGNTALVVSVSYHNGFIDLMKNPTDDKVANDEGLYTYDENREKKPFELNANLHHVALNVGILF
tara:strand:+ start:2585 stop:3394 length:810 start_codon:yes stop_codon:yes gene_type:complete